MLGGQVIIDIELWLGRNMDNGSMCWVRRNGERVTKVDVLCTEERSCSTSLDRTQGLDEFLKSVGSSGYIW